MRGVADPNDRFHFGAASSAPSQRRSNACSAAGGASGDPVDLLTPALLLCQERTHAARASPGFRSGREPSVSATVARLLLAFDKSEARAPRTLLAMP